MNRHKVIILGGGASGCFCALKTKEKDIAIIESSNKLLKKILVTGNGRCNLTNKNVNSSFYNQNIDRFLDKHNEIDSLKIFNRLGLETYFDTEGRCYPLSNSAKSVVDIISLGLVNKITTYLGYTALDIQRKDNEFIITTDKDTFSCNKLVIATGGDTMSKILTRLGIEVREFSPSLVALKSPQINDLNGIKLSNILVTMTNTEGKTVKEKGEILFKDGGISGIVIFNLSTLLAREANFSGRVCIDLLPDISYDLLVSKLRDRLSLDVSLDKFFIGFFQSAIANEILKQSGLNTNLNVKKLSNDHIHKLAETIKNLSFNINGCFDNNQVHSGGVKLTELDKNLMSNKIKNLYFCGEICDVDGICGGYNLQWAWTSGAIVGENL